MVNKDTHKVQKKVTNLKVKVLMEEPFVMRSRQDPTKFEGMFIDILDDITRRANLTYEISLQDDQRYGYEYFPGNWTGLIGSVQNKVSLFRGCLFCCWFFCLLV